MMQGDKKAIVRQRVEEIDGVSRSWFEWAWFEWASEDSGPVLVRTLVVEVDFDTDPNASQFRQSVLDEIKNTAIDVLRNETTMVVSRLKIVPKLADH